jgi:hypothetical protein
MPTITIPELVVINSQSALSGRVGVKAKDGSYNVFQCPVVNYSPEQMQALAKKGLIKDASTGQVSFNIEVQMEPNTAEQDNMQTD